MNDVHTQTCPYAARLSFRLLYINRCRDWRGIFLLPMFPSPGLRARRSPTCPTKPWRSRGCLAPEISFLAPRQRGYRIFRETAYPARIYNTARQKVHAFHTEVTAEDLKKPKKG